MKSNQNLKSILALKVRKFYSSIVPIKYGFLDLNNFCFNFLFNLLAPLLISNPIKSLWPLFFLEAGILSDLIVLSIEVFHHHYYL